jgi:biotin--protein ligase
MSLFLRTSLSHLPAQNLVFVQYLFALAVVEACRENAVLGTWGKSVRLKWPNDLYAVVGDGEKRKLGGILVNTNFTGGKVEMVLGILHHVDIFTLRTDFLNPSP